MATSHRIFIRSKFIGVLVAATLPCASLAHAFQTSEPETTTTAKPDATKSILASLPKPGKVVETTKELFGVTSARLDNGVRVHHRYLDTEKKSLLMIITLAGGEIEETKENAGITQAAFVTINTPETSRLTKRALRTILAEKNFNLGASANDDAVTIELRSSVRDFESGLQLLHALLTDGQLSAATFQAWKSKNLKNFSSFRRHIQWTSHNSTDEVLTGSDPRRTAFDEKRLEAVELSAVHAWYQRMCREAPIEVAVVGDIKLEVAMPLIQRYLGSLPKRRPTADHLKPLRRTKPLKGPVTRIVEYDATDKSEAVVIVGLHGFDPHNMRELRALQLATVLLDRQQLSLRDRSKLTPSIRAQFRLNWSFDDASSIMTIARCTPKNAQKLADAIFRSWERFGKTATTDKQLAEMKRQIKAGYVAAENNVDYWARTLGALDLNRRSLQDEFDTAKQLDKVTAADVQRVFNKYFTPEHRFQVITIPKKSTTRKTAKDQPDGKSSADKP